MNEIDMTEELKSQIENTNQVCNIPKIYDYYQARLIYTPSSIHKKIEFAFQESKCMGKYNRNFVNKSLIKQNDGYNSLIFSQQLNQFTRYELCVVIIKTNGRHISVGIINEDGIKIHTTWNEQCLINYCLGGNIWSQGKQNRKIKLLMNWKQFR